MRRKWDRELDYRLIKEVWAFRDNRIAVRFAYEWHDDSGNWFRSYGNENWEFDEHGLMRLRIASINDLPIKESERKYHWLLGRRPDDHPSLSELGSEGGHRGQAGSYERRRVHAERQGGADPQEFPPLLRAAGGTGLLADRITPDLARFIEAQTSIFLGTANKDGQPYIQHRGARRFPAGARRQDHRLRGLRRQQAIHHAGQSRGQSQGLSLPDRLRAPAAHQAMG